MRGTNRNECSPGGMGDPLPSPALAAARASGQFEYGDIHTYTFVRRGALRQIRNAPLFVVIYDALTIA